LLHEVKELEFRSRDSSVSIVTRLRAGRSGVRISAGARNYSILQSVPTDPVAHRVGTGVLTLGYSGWISVGVKKGWSRTSAPLCALVAGHGHVYCSESISSRNCKVCVWYIGTNVSLGPDVCMYQTVRSHTPEDSLHITPLQRHSLLRGFCP
jgi:hypothetical protein